MRRLIDALADDTDFFVEQVQLTAIVFDNSDDVTIWLLPFLIRSCTSFTWACRFSSSTYSCA
ncbi:hypothetical protein [Hymenobacter sp. AT01-02]|uniref:hypothetical protein n=1 Tax=Hymenobacter sp. AT01-02 TaxID=1571877 RepID=UPI00128F9CA7|nr:hypothetical protein [Hymenobacter sp. AT01-02]